MAGNDHVLLHSQKKQIITSAIAAGLNACDFLWEERNSKLNASQLVSVLIHRDTAYEFLFDYSAMYSEWRVAFTPAEKSVNGTAEFKTLEEALSLAGKWLTWLAREIDAQDYLAIAMQARPLLELTGTDPGDDDWSDQEQQEAMRALHRIEQHLLASDKVQDEHRSRVISEFRILRNELALSGRTAFRHMLFGALLSIGLTVLGTDGTRDLLAFAALQFNNILYVTHQLLTDEP